MRVDAEAPKGRRAPLGGVPTIIIITTIITNHHHHHQPFGGQPWKAAFGGP